MPLALSLFGKSQPGRFFAGPTLALDVGGSTAWLAGHANPDELAGFLNFCGCEAVVLDEAECPPPTGWKRAKTLSVFGRPPGRQLPLPEADAALWQSLEKNTEPAAGKTAEMLFPDRPGRRDDFYSELCSKRSRGLARVWTLEREGETSAPWEPMRWRMGRPIWPAARRPRPCGGAASAGGSSLGWPMPSRQRGGCPSSCAAPSGCISIPDSALRSWGSMRDTRRSEIFGSKVCGEIAR